MDLDNIDLDNIIHVILQQSFSYVQINWSDSKKKFIASKDVSWSPGDLHRDGFFDYKQCVYFPQDPFSTNYTMKSLSQHHLTGLVFRKTLINQITILGIKNNHCSSIMECFDHDYNRAFWFLKKFITKILSFHKIDKKDKTLLEFYNSLNNWPNN